MKACAHSGITVHRVQTRGKKCWVTLKTQEHTVHRPLNWIRMFRPVKTSTRLFVLLHWLLKKTLLLNSVCVGPRDGKVCYLMFCFKHRLLNSDHSLPCVWAVADVCTRFLDVALQSALRRHIKIRHWNIKKVLWLPSRDKNKKQAMKNYELKTDFLNRHSEQ